MWGHQLPQSILPDFKVETNLTPNATQLDTRAARPRRQGAVSVHVTDFFLSDTFDFF